MAICSVNRMFVLRSNVSFMCSFIELRHASLNFNTSESLISSSFNLFQGSSPRERVEIETLQLATT